MLACASLATTAARQAGPPSAAQSQKTIVDQAISLWDDGNCDAAIAAFEKRIGSDPDNFVLHTAFARAVSRSRYTRTGCRQVDAVRALYDRWIGERPNRAAYLYGAALFLDGADAARKKALLLKAAALAPKVADIWVELAILLHARYDDDAAVQYAKKGVALSPADLRAQATYAAALWPVDQKAARRVYERLLTRGKGTRDGALALHKYIIDVEDPAEKAALVERFRREWPNQWLPSLWANAHLFSAYFRERPEKGLAFAREMLAAPEQPPRDGEFARIGPGDFEDVWTRIVRYAQAIVDAQGLIRERKPRDALALLEKVRTPATVGDLPHLTLTRAEATAAAGDVPKAYEMLADELVTDSVMEYRQAIAKYGASLGKSAKQIDSEIWTRRLAKARAFKEFDLRTLDGRNRVKLSDLRGKIVLVDFWFPS